MSIGSFDRALDVIVRCREGELDRSLVRASLDSGEDGILRKIGEEASELVLACKDHKYGDGPREIVEEELGDVLYHLLLSMVHYRVAAEPVFRQMWEKREWRTKQAGLEEAFQRICACRDGEVKDSHIRKTLRKGDDKILRKIGEEAAEVIMAGKDYGLEKGPKAHVEEEVGDVLYYALIAMAHHEVGSDEVFGSLWRKYQLEDLPNKEAAPEFPDRPLALGSPFYVERPPIESDCYAEILRPGSLIRIRGPRNMGKTSLLNRILSHASERGLSTVRLNLERVDAGILSDLDRFLRWLAATTTQQLQLELALDEHWDAELVGSMESCTSYFQDYLFEQLEEPLVLALDGVDRLFDSPDIARDFFVLMRAWHEEANNLEAWENLRLVVAHSTEVYIPLNLNQSPFNVGRPVKLPPFTLEQVQDLAGRYQLEWRGPDAERLQALVGGHPLLVQLALFDIHRGTSLDELLKHAATQTGIYSNHLRSHLQSLQENPTLMTAFKKVVQASGGIELEPLPAYQLESLGLVQLEGNAATASCELYRQYFASQL